MKQKVNEAIETVSAIIICLLVGAVALQPYYRTDLEVISWFQKP
jgi:hypothetical protein